MTELVRGAGSHDHEAQRAAIVVAELIAGAVRQLEDRGIPDEALGVLVAARGVAFFRSSPKIRPVGRAWRLGVLLIDSAGAVYETGTVTRAIAPLRGVTNRSPEAEEKREYRLAASRGGFPEGEVVNVGHVPVMLDAAALRAGTGPLALEAGEVMIRWNAGALARLDRYLADRLSLLGG